MPWQWISRIFNRAPASHVSHPQALNAKHLTATQPCDSKHQGESNDPYQSNGERVKTVSSDLESAFFGWLLNCTDTQLKTRSDEQSDREQALLKWLDQHALSLEQLPRRPSSFPLLIKLLNNENSSTGEISNTLLSDPALATLTLKTANSPFFRVSNEPVESVEQAVFILGSEGIRNIISATVMMPMMKGNNSEESVFSKKVWEWGLLCATASDQYSHFQGHDPEALYILGLLPALSYLLIYRSILAYEVAHPSGGRIEESMIKSIIQHKNWKISHDICQQWGLPPSSNKYLLDAERPSPSSSFSPLRDGIFVGTHKALQTFIDSPLDDHSVFTLTGAPIAVDNKVMLYLETKLKESTHDTP